ncbi:MAG: biotin transporter BioY [Candidatus Kryptoniota bacterium]
MKDSYAISAETLNLYDESLVRVKNIAIFVVLTALGAHVYIPHDPVPFTLQTLFVLLAGGFLGWKDGTISMLSYLFLGGVGIPVFAGQAAGIQYLFGPTGGYLWGFVAAAAVVGIMVRMDSSVSWTVFSMLVGLVLVFACGTVYLNATLIHNWNISLVQGFLIFSIWDMIKLGAAVAIYRSLSSRFSFVKD